MWILRFFCSRRRKKAMPADKTFGESDYASNDGMLTSVWGPPLWHALHTISFNYPARPDRATRRKYYRFMRSLGDVLPCRYCRENYTGNVQALNFGPHHFKNRDTFSRYVYNLHEHVNTMLGKTSHLTYEKVRRRYENFRSRCLADPTQAACAAGAPAPAPDAPVEKGCTEPLHGTKSKCIMRIVPKESTHRTFAMDQKCCVRRGKSPPADS